MKNPLFIYNSCCPAEPAQPAEEAATLAAPANELAVLSGAGDALIDHEELDREAALWEGDDFDSDTLLEEDGGPAIDTGNVEWCVDGFRAYGAEPLPWWFSTPDAGRRV